MCFLNKCLEKHMRHLNLKSKISDCTFSNFEVLFVTNDSHISASTFKVTFCSTYIYIQGVSKKRGIRVYRLVCNRIFKIETIFDIYVQFLSQWVQFLTCITKNNNCTVKNCNLTLNIKLCKRRLSFTFYYAPVGNFRSL